jgi:hypothetical protein
MKKLILILPFMLTACDKQDAIIARSALVGFLVSVALITIVVPMLVSVINLEPLRIFLESISKLIYLAAFWIGIVLSGLGLFNWVNAEYSTEPGAISVLISGIGFTVGSHFLKKWHDDSGDREYLKSFFRIVILAVAVVVAIQMLI